MRRGLPDREEAEEIGIYADGGHKLAMCCTAQVRKA